MKKRWIITLLFTLILLIGTASCGRDNAARADIDQVADAQTPANEPENDTSQPAASSDFAGQTLSISISWSHTIEQFAELYMEANPGVNILVHNFDTDWERFMEQIPIQLMAGTADDLIDTMAIDRMDPSTTALLADWFPIMRAAPNFNEDNYFMNMLDAVSKDGRLFIFPIHFSFDMISANNRIPGLAEAFRGLDTISSKDMQAMYRAFATDDQFFLHENHDAMTSTIWAIDSFLDFENQTSYFNTPEFIEFITEAKYMTNPEKMFFGGTGSWTWHPPEVLEEQSQKYYFRQSIPQSFQFMLPFEEALPFSGHVPFTNAQGQLWVTPFFSYALNGRSSPEVQALAWDFLQFMQDPTHFEGEHWMYAMVPVYRPLLHSLLQWELPGRINFFEEEDGWRLVGNQDQAIAGVIAEFDKILQLPMADTLLANNAVSGIISEVMHKFNDGLLNAEQAADELHNRVTLTLLE